MSYILSIDQGTSSSRAVLFNASFQAVFTSQKEFTQYFPNEGWVEHDPKEIWHSVFEVVEDVLKNGPAETHEIASIGITNQRETTLIWDKETGEEIYPAIVWQDRRTADFCNSLVQEQLEDMVKEKTGLIIDPYFSASKIRWTLENVPGAKKKAEEGKLAFGTIDSFLVWKLTEGKVHKSDATNASRTMLYNINEDCWDRDLLKLFDIPLEMMPEVSNNVDEYGYTSLFGGEIKIGGMAGDQQSALIGQCCFNSGEAKCTFGTGAFLIINTGDKKIDSTSRLLSTIAYRFKDKITYGLEGSVFVAGSSIQWLRDELGFFKNASDTESLVSSRDNTSNVLVVPAFTGLGAPHWDPEARGAIFGITRATGVKEITAATLESIAFQTRDLIEASVIDGADIKELRVDGGMVANDWFNKRLSSLLGMKILKPKFLETTALGAAYLAGISSGLVDDFNHLQNTLSIDKEISPIETEKALLDIKYRNWLKAVEAVKTIKD